MAITFQCPFYRIHTGKEAVKCEGGYTIRFKNGKLFDRYTKRYCRTFNYGECGIAKIWEDYYAEK